MGLGSRKQPTTAAPPLKDLIYQLVANLVLLLVSGTTFLALLLLQMEGARWVLGLGLFCGLVCLFVFLCFVLVFVGCGVWVFLF